MGCEKIAVPGFGQVAQQVAVVDEKRYVAGMVLMNSMVGAAADEIVLLLHNTDAVVEKRFVASNGCC